jgi:O-succinylbenzoate-CoA ligase
MKQNIGLILTKRAHLNPDLEGYVDGDTGKRYTFSEMNRRCNQTANALTMQGVKPGDRVAILMMNSIEFMETFFAVAKLGGVVVPLNWRLVPDELEFILKDSGSEALIFGTEFQENAEELHSRGDKTDLRIWIQQGGEDKRSLFALDYDHMQSTAPDDEPEPGGEEDDMLYIMYTSGTTGLPKGVIHTHNTALWGVLTIFSTAEMRYRDRYLLALPMFHVGALTPLTVNVYGGVTSIVMRQFDPVKTWQLIEGEKVTVMLAVPAMLNFMLQVPEFETTYDYSTLRWCMSGASPVPISLIEAYDQRNIQIQQIYGLTETCGPACLISTDDAITKAGSTGKAFLHTDVRVVDENGNDSAPGEAGEVVIRGKHVMVGYWNRPDATAETIRDGWLYSGDVAEWDEDGFIFIRDRTKDMIISGGENIYPAEIENVILSHPKVGEVAVIGQPSDTWGESPLAVVVKADSSLEASEVMKHCDGKLSRFKLPHGVEFIDEIPRNPSGKVLKRLLRDQFPGPAPK